MFDVGYALIITEGTNNIASHNPNMAAAICESNLFIFYYISRFFAKMQ
jgi:hypothetical protein